MSQHHGKPAITRKCKQCGKPFKVWRSALKRRAGRFCSQPCYAAAKRAFMASYGNQEANQLPLAA
jgi:hypothetical protein